MEPILELLKLCTLSDNTNTKLAEIKSLVQTHQFDLLTDFNGRTPIHFLATRDNIEAIKYLLVNLPGLDINQKDDMGWTPLSNGCYLGTLPMIIDLLARGANPSIIDFGGKTLLHLVAGNTKLSAEDKELALWTLQQKRINPKVKDFRGQTYEDVLKFDQSKDMEKTGIDPFGRTILHWAAYSFAAYETKYKGYKELIDRVDDVGRTPLMYAAGIPQPNIPYLNWLIETGCEVKKQDKGGKTAIHFAARWGNKDVVQCLLEHGSDHYLPDNMGQTPVAIATRYSPQVLPILEADVALQRACV